jgi:hypothetical protein
MNRIRKSFAVYTDDLVLLKKPKPEGFSMLSVGQDGRKKKGI